MNKVIKIGGIVIVVSTIGYIAYKYFLKDYFFKKNNKSKSLADIKGNLQIEKALKKRKFDVQPNLKESNTNTEKSSFIETERLSWS